MRTLVVVALLVLIAACGSAPPGPTHPLAGRETRDLVVRDYLALGEAAPNGSEANAASP